MIHELSESERLKIEDAWEGHSGQQVEDFICRNVITEGSYVDSILALKNASGDSIVEIPVSVVEPTYDYAICLYGLKIDGTVYKDSSLVMQYKKSTKVELGIGIRSVMDREGIIKNYNTTFKVDINFNNQSLSTQIRNIDYSYFELLNNNYVLGAKEGIEDALVWVDVTKLFTKVAKNKKIQASFKPAELTLTSTLSMDIVNEIINLTYNGNTVINSNQLQLTFDNAQINIADYQLVYYINGVGEGSNPIKLNAGLFIISNLVPGLNQIVIRAEHNQNAKICSDWISFNVIYTKDFTGTAVAVNGVNKDITNNGVATLYKLIIYSTNREEFEFTTYLENILPSENPKPTQIIKQEYITAYSYDKDTNTTDEYTYKKYIELENVGGAQYLLIKIKDKFYTFYRGNYSNALSKYSVYSSPYVEMNVEECILEYTYVKNYPINYNFDQITGQANNIFITELQSPEKATLIADLESTDGWKELDGLTYLKLSKLGKSVLKNPINLNLSDSFTIEMGFRTYNISDRSQTILTLGKLGLYPTQLGWMYEDITSEDFLKRNSQFLENQNTHIVITVAKNWNINNSVYYPNYLKTVQSSFDEKAKLVSYNLVRIYINGCIDREFILNDINDLKNATLNIQPNSSDIDFYLFRVYNSHALTHEDVIRNYISYIPEKTGEFSKESVYTKNDILNEAGKISWNKCLGKQNTLLFIYHKNGTFPNRFWGREDNESSNDANKKIPCTLIINYADPTINARYGGVLDKLQCKGQGSSAMRYLIWNVNSSLNKLKYKNELNEEKKATSKFLPYSNLLTREGRGELLPENTNVDEVISEYYVMPPYKDELDTTAYKYTKMVGKVNFASSMQSHKIGACKLYDDAYKKSLGTAALPSGGKKAVHEEPFMYFYIETDEPFNKDYSSALDIDSITYDRILELGEQAEFMGFLTWGPGKGDDACSGYDEDLTPEYLMLEGGENTDASVNFLRPWQALQRLRTDFVREGLKYNYATDLMQSPTVNKELSIKEPWAQILIDDESIVYTDRGAWDIDYGFSEDEIGETKYFDFTEGAKVSLAKFREFYDTVYKYDFTFIRVDGEIKSPQDWNIYKKYLVMSPDFYIDGKAVNGHQSGDIYRYDEPTKSWVPAGVYYNNGWERLNYRLLILEELEEDAQTEAQIKDILKAEFTRRIKEFIKLDDIAFHQAFIKFLSGTDNRAKNTYFLIIGSMSNGGGDYKIRLIGDDLDTILVTDNSGLLSKPYNLIEDSYDESYEKVWGDAGNLFFRMFDLCFELEIKGQLLNIMTFANITSKGVNLKSSYFYNVFFKVLEDFPQIAYNHTASIYYENAYIIKNCGASYGFNYTHNNVDPIAQSHGSCLECEKQFMKERLDFLAGYAKACLDYSLATSSAAAGGEKLRLLLEFEPFLDFYPTYFYEGRISNIGKYSDSEYDIIKYKASVGNKYVQTVKEEGDGINLMLYQMNLYKSLSITGLLVSNINAEFNTTTDLTIDNNLIELHPELFREGYPKIKFAEFNPNLPVLENLNLVGVTIEDDLDLINFSKLKSINLSSSVINSIIFPQSGLLSKVILPESIRTFEIYNNPGFTKDSVEFEGYNNIETVYIDCTKCGQFDVSDFCEHLSAGSLNSIILKNINNINLTEETLRKLLNCSTCVLEGEITIIDTTGTIKEISFETKQMLVNIFGNIDTGSNGLKINYIKSNAAPTIIYPESADAYYDTNLGGVLEKANPFALTIIGNNVNIIEGDNPVNNKLNHRLDIRYELLTGNPSEITIDPITGNITLKKSPSLATVKIIINGIYHNGSNPTELIFTWIAPLIGYLAYADGTFSKKYTSSKDLLGIIYDKKGDADNGELYILGTDITNTKEWVSYLTDDRTTGTGSEAGVEGFTTWFTNNIHNTIIVPGLENHDTDSLSKISIKTREVFAELIHTGQLDTKMYVDYVNTNVLPYIWRNIPESLKYINSSTVDGKDTYSIDSISDLNQLCTLLQKLLNAGIPGFEYYYPSILFPYFYSAWIYNIPSDYYTGEQGKGPKLQWYSPSVAEWAKIVYQYGYSCALDNFTESNFMAAFNGSVQDVNENSYNDNFATTPIFALAKKAILSTSYPKCWNDIIDGENISGNEYKHQLTTTRNNVGNYGYVRVQEYAGSNYIESAVWRPGLYQRYTGGGDWGDYLKPLWGYTIRKGGLPFTTIPYKNPLKQ